MTEWILSSAVLIVMIMVIRRLFREKISRILRYALWLPVLFRLLLPVTFIDSRFNLISLLGHGTVGIAGTDSAGIGEQSGSARRARPMAWISLPEDGIAEQSQSAQQKTGGIYGGLDFLISSRDQKASGGQWKDTFLFIWAAGSILTGALFIGCNLVFYCRLRKGRVLYGAPEGALKCKIQVYMAADLSSPCLFGILHPAVYVTPRIEEEGVYKEYVICHELCHYRHGDHIWSFLRGVCISVWWWNPLVWLAARLSAQDAESACDEAVIACFGEADRIAYGRTLVNMITVKKGFVSPFYCATMMAATGKGIRRRLELLLKSPKKTFPAAAAVLALVAVCLMFTLTGSRDETKTNQEENVPGPIAQVIQDVTEGKRMTEGVISEEEIPLTGYDMDSDLLGEMAAEVKEWYELEVPYQMGTALWDIYSVDEVIPIAPKEWDTVRICRDIPLSAYRERPEDEENWLSCLENRPMGLIKLTLSEWYYDEALSVAPYEQGKVVYYILMEITANNGIVMAGISEPEFIEKERPETLSKQELDRIAEWGLDSSGYRDFLHQLQALCDAGISRNFSGYMDFTEQEFKRYMAERIPYFFGAMYEAAPNALMHIARYDFSDDEEWGSPFALPDYVDTKADWYDLEEPEPFGDEPEEIGIAVVTDPYLIRPGLIGQRAEILHFKEGAVVNTGSIEYRFAFQEGGRVYIAGGILAAGQ